MPNQYNKNFKALLSIILLLVGCGGSSDDDNSSGSGNGGNNQTANTAPIANAGTDQNVSKSTQVTLNGNQSSDANSDALSYFWSITAKPVDSNASLSASDLPNPTFVADQAGNYQFSLTVNDGTTNSQTDSVSVIASNSVPQANAGSDVTVDKGLAVIFNGNNSVDENNDLLTYSWQLISSPPGSTATLLEADTITAVLTPDLSGMYQLSLSVNDGTVDSPADIIGIEAVNTAPTANAGGDRAVNTTAQVQLDGSRSADFNGDPLTYLWHINSKPQGSISNLSDDTAVNPIFLADIDGSYVVELTVNDKTINSNREIITIIATTVAVNTPPVAHAGDDQSLPFNSAVQLDGSLSFDADGNTLSYRWIFNAKPNGSTAALPDSHLSNPTFNADIKGDYLLTLVVNDGQSDSNIDSVTIKAINTIPIANAGTNQAINTGALVTLNGQDSSDLNADLLSYLWVINSVPFGSNASLSAHNIATPTFTADLAGSYHFTLNVNDGTTDSIADQITVIATTVGNNTRPIANAGSDQQSFTGITVNLDGSQSSDGDGNTLTYHWAIFSQPAGSDIILNNANKANPSFIPQIPGHYSFTLVVNDSDNNSDPDGVTVTATNATPTAHAGNDQTVKTGSQVNLDGSASADPDGNPLSYLWSIDIKPQGSTSSLSDSRQSMPFFVPDLNGNYQFSLTVNDGNETSNIDTVKVTAFNIQPVADAGEAQAVNNHTQVTLNGSNSSDGDGDTLTYQWLLLSAPSRANVTLAKATTATPSFRPTIVGHYLFELVVNDGTIDSLTDTVSVSVSNNIPTASAGNDQYVGLGSTVLLNGRESSDPDDNTLLSYRWTMDNKPQGSNATLSSFTTVNSRFIGDVRGIYDISLIVNDGTDASAPDPVQITVDNTTPIARAGNDQSVHTGSTVTLNGSASSDLDNDTLSFKWSIEQKPDGSTAPLSSDSVVTPTLIVEANGTYTISLIVNDGQSDSEPDLLVISAINTIPVADAGVDQTINEGETVNLDGSQSSDSENSPLTYQWTLTSLPATSTASLTNSTTTTPTLTVDTDGTYNVSLVVNDGINASIADSVVITALNIGPVADAGQDIQININNLINLDGSNSSDGDNSPITHSWSINSLPPGSSVSLSEIHAISPSVTPDIAGSYKFTLTITDDQSNSVTDTVLVNAVRWIKNTNVQSTYITDNGSGVLVGVQSVTDNNLNDIEFLAIQTTSIPNYRVRITPTHIDELNSRPNANTDFSSGSTTASVDSIREFGQSVGYTSEDCSLGYWPKGYVCPTEQNKQQNLPIRTTAAATPCSTGPGSLGVMLNGTALFNWLDGSSFNDQGVWQNISAKFEFYDLDICQGHANTSGHYHHHGFSACLQQSLDDEGQGHSPIYGYAGDGYALYGPYHSAGVLAKSSWVARDYDSEDSLSGCSQPGERSCQLVDQFDLSKGTTPSTTGPTTSETITSTTATPYITTSGYYFEDYYHDTALIEQSAQHLDKHNGHTHDNYGYHYHLTAIDNDGALEATFPYSTGPTLYGELPQGSMATCQ